jgi:polyferredoxin
MPFDFKDYYKSKFRFSMLICSLGSVSYILILGIVCMVTGIVPITGSWVFLYSAFVCVLCNLIFVNRMLVSNAKSPVFSRDSETEISRKLGGINAVALIIGFVMYIALFVFIIIAMIPELSSVFLNSTTGTVAAVTAAVFALLIFVIAVAVNKTSVKKAEKSLMIIE